ncbi:hypothetical protein [Singapore grouper iridovirus]|uniref:Uncharacterized protein n=1 Tax=Singapore grouper iridovirus TaxID=262968 RepID=Q5YFQ5_9VIRU|nr:hypothetical protein ORF010L [Singapore grouper iridovirus]AAS18025.1 unknown [Singapore grouper iridovirus]WAU86719.1 hypothetical protein ORF010L [Singapore grouper iridovirus]WRW24724.1 hypothetical protein [Singapore grouper iridovirus]
MRRNGFDKLKEIKSEFSGMPDEFHEYCNRSPARLKLESDSDLSNSFGPYGMTSFGFEPASSDAAQTEDAENGPPIVFPEKCPVNVTVFGCGPKDFSVSFTHKIVKIYIGETAKMYCCHDSGPL